MSGHRVVCVDRLSVSGGVGVRQSPCALFFTVLNVSSQTPEQGAANLVITEVRGVKYVLGSRVICLNKMGVNGGVGIG